MLFAKPKKAIGLDMGTHSVKAVQMSRVGGRLVIDDATYVPIDRNLVNADPIGAQADAVRQALSGLPVSSSLVVGALPGHTVVIRYPRISDVPRQELASTVEREAGQSIPYDLSEVFLDWSVLDEVDENERTQLKVMLVAAKHEVIDSRVQITQAANVAVGVLTVDSLCLADAAAACDFLRVGETVALVNIGQTSASIHFVKDGISNFIRDVNWGARELVQAVAKERRCDLGEAEKQLMEAAQQVEPDTLDAELEVAVEIPEALAIAEEVDEESPFGDTTAGSPLDPLDDELELGAMSGAPSTSATSMVLGDDERSIQDVISVPLSRLVAEVRRSFDYYEHQLYERPVDRLILSGGIAHLPALQKVLNDELGVDSVELSDPSNSALLFGDRNAVAPLRERPSQYMVAVGLAARGMDDL